jgi:hypothetical protein
MSSQPEAKRRLAAAVDTIESIMDELRQCNLKNKYLSINVINLGKNIYSVGNLETAKDDIDDAANILSLYGKLIEAEASRRKKNKEVKHKERIAARKMAALKKRDSKCDRELPQFVVDNLSDAFAKHSLQERDSACEMDMVTQDGHKP